ncbi:MAG: hypothetical protein WKF37_05385 [Bryobacteraceae bacterium]
MTSSLAVLEIAKPTYRSLLNDIDTVIGTAFQFYRMTRNDVGHPEITPTLAKPLLYANVAQMPFYIVRIYALIDYFNTNEMSF